MVIYAIIANAKIAKINLFLLRMPINKKKEEENDNNNNIELNENDNDEKKLIICTCSKSGCNKNYCECFKAKVKCNNKCRCIKCLNKQDEKKDIEETKIIKNLI